MMGTLPRSVRPARQSGRAPQKGATSAPGCMGSPGSFHARRAAADARRDRKLRRWGYRVLRLEAALVLRDLPEALRRVGEALGRS